MVDTEQSRKAVMFITPSAYVLSGLATWLDYMDPGLNDAGWGVTIGLVEGPRYHKPEKYLAEHAHQGWVAIKCNSNTQEGRLRAVERAVLKVRPDIVITVNLPDAILGSERLRRKSLANLKIVMAVHGIQPDLYDDIKAYGSLLDGVFCVNRLACKLVVEHCGMDAGKVFYTPCGVNLGLNKRREQGEMLKLAYVGRLEQNQKQIFDLPEILGELDKLSIPWALKVAGAGPDEGMLRQKLSGFHGRVVFLGSLQPEALHQQVFDVVDVLLLTSIWETGPLVVWEAMANGVAVVSSCYIGYGLEAALHHEVNALLFPVGDVVDAATQIQRLWREPELQARLRCSAFRLIEQRYSMAVSVEQWDRHLRALLQQLPMPAVSQTEAQPTGRLDRLLGCSNAESVRSLLGRIGPDGGAGGEWPHSHGKTDYWDGAFWKLVGQLDQRNETGC